MARAISGKKNCSSSRGTSGPPSGPIVTSAQIESHARTRSNSSRSANTHPSIGAETVSSPNDSVKRANLNRKAPTGQTSAQPSSSGASDRMAGRTNRDSAQKGGKLPFLNTGIAQNRSDTESHDVQESIREEQQHQVGDKGTYQGVWNEQPRLHSGESSFSIIMVSICREYHRGNVRRGNIQRNKRPRYDQGLEKPIYIAPEVYIPIRFLLSTAEVGIHPDRKVEEGMFEMESSHVFGREEESDSILGRSKRAT